jgi:hypothetical protein
MQKLGQKRKLTNNRRQDWRETNGFPSLPRTTPLGSFLGSASDEADLVEAEDCSDDPSAIIKGYAELLLLALSAVTAPRN